MMRTMMALALVTALVGCDEKKSAPETQAAAPATTPVAPAASGAAVSGEAAKPSGAAAGASGEAAKPSGAAATPSGATAGASGEAAKSSGEAAKPADKAGKAEAGKAAHPPKGGSATKSLPPPGVMPHGNPEDGTLKYNPPPSQNPPAKKDAAH